MKRFFLALSLFSFLLTGCKEDPSPATPPPVNPTTKGVYVLNEGDFNDPTGARLTFYDPETDSIFKNVYESANGNQSLGNLGDDMLIAGDKLYVTMSGSDEIKVLDVTSNKVLLSKQLPGDDPHDLCYDAKNNRIYVTRLYKNSVLVLNSATLAIIDSVSVGPNPLGMILVDSLLFVCNSGYGSGSTVSIININTLKVSRSVSVGAGPSSAVIVNGKVFITCTGNAFAQPAVHGSMYSISAATKSVVDTLLFDEVLFGNSAVGKDGNIYVIGSTPGSFFGGPVHKIDPATGIKTKHFIAGTFYAIAVDQTNGKFYLSDVKNFAADGEVAIHEQNGAFLKKFSAQRGPGTFAFKR